MTIFCVPRLDRWLGLSAAMIMMGCAGLTYTYAVYSEHMKQRLHFSQEDVDDIGAAKDLGGVVGVLSGLFYNMYPPWVTIGIGAALHFFGYTMVWMTVAGKVAPSFWLLCMYSAVGNGGDNWIDTACMMTSLQNYEEQRGTAMGILKAQLGLSGAIFVMIYEVFLEPNVNQFLLLMSLVPTLAYVLLAFFVRPFDHTEDEDPSAPPRFKMAFITVLVLGIFMMVSLASKEYFKESKLLQLMTITIMLSIMLIMYTIPLIRFPRKFFPPSSEGIDLPKLETKAYDLQDAEEERLNLLKTGADPSQVLTHSQIATPAAASTGHTTLKDALADFNFWLVFLVVTIGAGTGVAIINNLAQIGKSLRAGGTDIYVGLISVWSCFGRLGSGYGSDLLMRRGYPRTLCLLIDQMIMALCCLLLATGLISSLFIGSALTGLSYGAYWTLIPAILSEVFGVQNFTVLYKLVSLGPPLGSYILSAKVMGSLYDEEAALYRQKSGGASVPAGGDDLNNCYGSKCFGFGLVALSLVSLVGAAASFLLFLGTKRAYHKNQVK
ncbi:protein NUCLEAR FUSION DEFECTIVE 4 isoform X2 [Selaginella moellendorffii]|nr:protein NUCLEAR FUSION DEFECTIVE 4 isoform X2 [Selaginella moellendorffii]|eukprot:XP_024544900.1 protein NUCLEAR FUSION DEFECTIVE 4 isoform X2 [Selaginella moellendorffii]